MNSDKQSAKQRQIANLKPFKKGQSGNPKGRPPKDKCIPEILRQIGHEAGTKDGSHTKLDVLLRKVYQFALDGKPWAVQFIADRTEGKPLQAIQAEVQSKGENPFAGLTTDELRSIVQSSTETG